MNILHMKYEVEIAKLGSINKASEALLIAQPNLSRAVKELETDLGVSIFDRSSKGMFLTPEGEKFIGYAKKILQQIEEVENMYKTGAPAKQKFSVCVPRASYISDAFANFSTQFKTQAAEIFYQETNSSHVINNVLNAEYKLGILRYAENFDKYFKATLEEKGLTYELITEFTYQLIMNRNNPLASYGEIRCEHLRDFIEIAHADPFVPSLPLAEVKKEELPDDIERRIFVFERASQFDLLAENEQTFMWVSPVPDKTLQRYGLVQRKCADNTRVYKDMLIYRKDYKLTETDQCFITELCNSK
ncbi:MAG: LysR family transcriptional regulator, partial [Lachnospiraceae bacterium]|nr:LysR family transcriptional regulator [Lachnospiraceae bacterium]